MLLFEKEVLVKKKPRLLQLVLEDGTEDVVKSHYAGHEDYVDPEQFKQDYQAIMQIIHGEGINWEEVFESIVKKLDGSFAKARKQVLYRGYSEHYYAEDNYAWMAPELRMESVADDKAVIVFRQFMSENYEDDNTGRFQSISTYKPNYHR